MHEEKKRKGKPAGALDEVMLSLANVSAETRKAIDKAADSTKKIVSEKANEFESWVSSKDWPDETEWAFEETWPTIKEEAARARDFTEEQIKAAWAEVKPIAIEGAEIVAKTPGYVKDGALYVWNSAKKVYERVSPEKVKELLSDSYKGTVKPVAVAVVKISGKVVYFVYDSARKAWIGFEKLVKK